MLAQAATCHPHYIRWWNEQVNLIRQTGGLSALPLQEEKPMFENETLTVPLPTTEIEEASQGTRCEYCGVALKSAKQARAIHLRYCEAYKAANGATPPAPAFGNGNGVILTPEQTSKLWEVITGGHLEMFIQDGQVLCRVGLDSFNKALPVLLERL